MSNDFCLLVGYTGNQNVTPTDIFADFWQHTLSTLITKINVAKLNSSVKVKVWAFHYDVILQMRSFVSFNNSKFITDKNSLKALQVYCKVYSKNSWLILRRLHYMTLDHALLQKTQFSSCTMLNLSNFTIHCDIIKLNITEHCFLLSGFNLSIWLPYYRKLTLHEIKVLEINAT